MPESNGHRTCCRGSFLPALFLFVVSALSWLLLFAVVTIFAAQTEPAGNLSYRHRPAQDAVVAAGGLAQCMAHSVVDEENPYIREWCATAAHFRTLDRRLRGWLCVANAAFDGYQGGASDPQPLRRKWRKYPELSVISARMVTPRNF